MCWMMACRILCAVRRCLQVMRTVLLAIACFLLLAVGVAAHGAEANVRAAHSLAAAANTAPLKGLDQRGMNYQIGVWVAILLVVVGVVAFYTVGSIDFTEDDTLITVDVLPSAGTD